MIHPREFEQRDTRGSVSAVGELDGSRRRDCGRTGEMMMSVRELLRQCFGIAFAFSLCLSAPATLLARDGYKPAPSNLAARRWFRSAKFGLFIHWGVYSVLGDG